VDLASNCALNNKWKFKIFPCKIALQLFLRN
jgi:hypothetical protein